MRTEDVSSIRQDRSLDVLVCVYREGMSMKMLQRLQQFKIKRVAHYFLLLILPITYSFSQTP